MTWVNPLPAGRDGWPAHSGLGPLCLRDRKRWGGCGSWAQRLIPETGHWFPKALTHRICRLLIVATGVTSGDLVGRGQRYCTYPTMHKVAHMPTFHKELSGLTYQLMPWLSKISQRRQLLEGPFWMFSPLPGMTCTYIQSFLFPPKDDYNWHSRADGSSFFSSLICWSSEVLKSWTEGWVVWRLGSSSIHSIPVFVNTGGGSWFRRTEFMLRNEIMLI